ncbi:MAG: M20 family metallopeptidase [Arcanobacterium sp.]|nr:M20 family metallopeptidase [Arcanobacterium sp.]
MSTHHEISADPLPPFPGYSQHLAKHTDELRQASKFDVIDRQGAPEELVAELERCVDSLGDEITDMSHFLHAHPELGFEEYEAQVQFKERVEAHGVPVQTGVYGVQTAFEATLSNGDGPTIAIISEYDALPEIGHACGHCVMGSAGMGGFLGLVELAKKNPQAFHGTVKFIGTPAEEGKSGKAVMIQGGAFKPDDIDAAIMFHSYGYDLANQTWLGRRTLTVHFHGVAAHASSQPWMGRNALDAAVLAYQGLAVLRQQIPPEDRIHEIITDGGTRQSIITEHSTMKFYIRSKFPDTLRDLSQRVENVINGAALMTGCGVEIIWDESPATLPVRSNHELESRWVIAQRRRGRDPLPHGVVSETLAASTDFGNVSYRVPGIQPLVKVSAEDVALHTRAMAQAAGSPQGDKAAIDGAFGLAAVALDFLCDADLRTAVRDEFESDGGYMDAQELLGA